MSKLKPKSVQIAKESRYLSTTPGGKGWKRVYYRIVAQTSKGQMMLKVLFTDAKRATGIAANIIEKGYINSTHWEM